MNSYFEPAPPYRGSLPFRPPGFTSELELTDLTPYVPPPSNRQPSRKPTDSLPPYTPPSSSLPAAHPTLRPLHSARPFTAEPFVRMRSPTLLDMEEEERDLECVIAATVAVLMVAGVVVS